MTLPHPEAHGHGHEGADSAGTPWSDRALSSTGFDDDRGEADPELIAALNLVATASTSHREAELVPTIAAHRWLVPVVAMPTEVDHSGEHAVEKSTDMATVIMTGPDGSRALPIFSSVAALLAWDPQARPVPVTAARAAQAAIAEQCTTLLVDVHSPYAIALRPSMVWALAQQQPWTLPWEDDFVAKGINAATRDESLILHVERSSADPAEPTPFQQRSGGLRLTFTLQPGLTAEGVNALATRVGERIALDGELRAHIDALAFTIVGPA